MKQPLNKSNPFSLPSFKPNVSLQNQAFLVDTNMFNDETQLVISLMSHFLGLDTDTSVIELLMSFPFKVRTSPSKSSQSVQSVCFKYYEFLAESIHS